MKIFKSILLLGLVFAAGIVIGVVGTRTVVRHFVGQAILHPERAQLFMEHALTRRLRLDDEQQVKLHDILTETHTQLKDVQREYRPRISEIMSNADGQITAMLTSAQQEKFQQLKSQNHPLLQAIQQGR